MADVYAQCVVSIAASSAEDGSQGCFFDRDPGYLWNTAFEISGNDTTEAFMMAGIQILERSVRHTELSKRAWVLQEHLLSPRTYILARHKSSGNAKKLARASPILEDFRTS